MAGGRRAFHQRDFIATLGVASLVHKRLNERKAAAADRVEGHRLVEVGDRAKIEAVAAVENNEQRFGLCNVDVTNTRR